MKGIATTVLALAVMATGACASFRATRALVIESDTEWVGRLSTGSSTRTISGYGDKEISPIISQPPVCWSIHLRGEGRLRAYGVQMGKQDEASTTVPYGSVSGCMR